MIKKAIVIPYFGEWPKWFDLYLYSLGNNLSFDVLFFTDIPTNDLLFVPPNAKFINISFKDYCRRASEKLSITFNPSNPFKLCDLRPFYPIIHQEELKEYDYIGWGDIDLIYGNLNKFFPDSRICKYNIISTHSHIFSGHFTLIRNIPSIYECFTNMPNWKSMLSDTKNHVMDEIGLSYYLTPKLKYIRHIYDKSGGFNGELKKWAVHLMQISAKLLYPKYFFREMWTTTKPNNESFFTYEAGAVTNNRGMELPYVHFYFFKKPNYKTLRTNYWRDNFYQLDSYDISDNTKIMIDREGIRMM